jgi:hypothetical protein
LSDGILLVFGIALVFVLALFERLGSYVRRTAEGRGHDVRGHEERIVYIMTSTFGLLALLIGFTFSIALNRYDTRRSDVVLEANAIGTAHYRAAFIELKYGAKLQESLEEFAVHRLAYGQAGIGERRKLENISGRLRNDIGAAGMLIQPVANSPIGASIVAGITDVECSTRSQSERPHTVDRFPDTHCHFGAGCRHDGICPSAFRSIAANVKHPAICAHDVDYHRYT